jgi:hypothetical protein
VVAVVSDDPAGDGGAADADGSDIPSDAPDHTLLRLVHLSTAPDLDAMDVKRWAEARLLGARADVRVIGSSHCLSVPGAGFHELCSCRPLPELGVHPSEDAAAPGDGAPAGAAGGPGAVSPRRIPLSPGVERTLTTTTGEVRAATTVEGLGLDAFPADRDFDVRYRFGPDAVTAITLDGDRFETYHTYPEFDLALRSETVLGRLE